ncbi:hypothetical protein ZIOFF_053713 [Zingiber officinale]|uniref:DUF868 family protein n=1 Tax=Zingiber officinale TaxID=94328 RepID=A0A8J5FGH9_ZINOF|nr:hypothetical protein ZIOFF_053713 [Zingiber officinale]
MHEMGAEALAAIVTIASLSPLPLTVSPLPFSYSVFFFWFHNPTLLQLLLPLALVFGFCLPKEATPLFCPRITALTESRPWSERSLWPFCIDEETVTAKQESMVGGIRMRDFPSCFGESGIQVSDSSSSSGGNSKSAQNLVTCLYQAQLFGRPSLITVTWSKNLMGQSLSIEIDELAGESPCKLEIKPWLFSKRKGFKSLNVEEGKINLFWDLSAAKFGPGPEPLECYYVAVVVDHELVLLLGDLSHEARQKTNAVPGPSSAAFIAKREHIYGRNSYSTKAQFCNNGNFHDVSIECDTVGVKDPCLEICIDNKRVMQIKRLAWKFRGNQTILVDGLPVEVFWDVHSWLFGPPNANAVFMFQTCLSAEKFFPWSATSQLLKQSHLQSLGFSLILHAWKTEQV